MTRCCRLNVRLVFLETCWVLVGQVADGDLHAVHHHIHIVVVGVQVNITKIKDKRGIWLCIRTCQPNIFSFTATQILTCQQSSHWCGSAHCCPSSAEPWTWAPRSNPEPESGCKTWASRSCTSCCWTWSGCSGRSYTGLYKKKQICIYWSTAKTQHHGMASILTSTPVLPPWTWAKMYWTLSMMLSSKGVRLLIPSRGSAMGRRRASL